MKLTAVTAIGAVGWSAAISAAALSADFHTRWMWCIVAAFAMLPSLLPTSRREPAQRRSENIREAQGW
jgi:hypothetical protein